MNSDAIARSRRILTIPNVLSLLRVCFIPLILLFIWERDLHWALILFVAAGISDGLDGTLARLLKQKTLFGMYLDPVADKLLLSSSFLVLAITGEISWLVTGMVLGRDVVLIIGVIVLLFSTDVRQFPRAFSESSIRWCRSPAYLYCSWMKCMHPTAGCIMPAWSWSARTAFTRSQR